MSTVRSMAALAAHVQRGESQCCHAPFSSTRPSHKKTWSLLCSRSLVGCNEIRTRDVICCPRVYGSAWNELLICACQNHVLANNLTRRLPAAKNDLLCLSVGKPWPGAPHKPHLSGSLHEKKTNDYTRNPYPRYAAHSTKQGTYLLTGRGSSKPDPKRLAHTALVVFY